MTTIDPLLLEILVCPENKQPVKLAEEALIQRLNTEQREGRLKNRAGEPVKESMEAGLIRSDGAYVYPVIDGIPVMLIDEAIPVNPPSA